MTPDELWQKAKDDGINVLHPEMSPKTRDAIQSIEIRFATFEVVQKQILAQTTKTNGRVDRLEEDRESITTVLNKLSGQVDHLNDVHDKLNNTTAKVIEKLIIGLIVIGATILANLWSNYQQDVGARNQLQSLQNSLSGGDYVLEVVE